MVQWCYRCKSMGKIVKSSIQPMATIKRGSGNQPAVTMEMVLPSATLQCDAVSSDSGQIKRQEETQKATSDRGQISSGGGINIDGAAFIYRSVKGYLPWIRYVAHQKEFQYSLRRYSRQWAGYNKVYPYRKKCTTSGRSVPLRREFSLFIGRVLFL